MQVTKRGLYDLTGDYRNIAYFNALPSFANPLAPRGFNERAFDTRRRSGQVDLQFFPGKHVLPYLVFERNSGYGHGVETWLQDANNEYAVPLLLRDSTNNYRGGLRLEYNRWHVTVEQGGTTYKDDDQASFNGVHYGDRTTPLLGSTLVLNTLRQTYGVRGASLYSKVLATASPFSWMNLYGQYLHSKCTAGNTAWARARQPRRTIWPTRGSKSGPSGACASSNRLPPTGTTPRARAHSPNNYCFRRPRHSPRWLRR
ncbi:MAG: hypothetical protein NTW28_05795 [Candidatus Solibacter sp.]|nr:hypothetical protein [Candidatus Solibacter sp.]